MVSTAQELQTNVELPAAPTQTGEQFDAQTALDQDSGLDTSTSVETTLHAQFGPHFNQNEMPPVAFQRPVGPLPKVAPGTMPDTAYSGHWGL